MAMRPPIIEELSEAEALEFLARHNVGRLAYSFRDRVDIVPIHYVNHDGWLYGRTSPGPKLTTLAHSRWVAFEVDEVRGLFDWTSVVVKGALLLLDAEGSSAERAAWQEGLRLLRELVPEALAAGDPTPHRDVLFRIHVSEATGRRARPAG